MMPITFRINKEEGYTLSNYIGIITDTCVLDSYQNFYDTNDEFPLKELVDLSESDLSELSSDGLRSLSNYIEDLFEEKNITVFHTAIYAPKDLSYGLSRIYNAFSDDSSETTCTFRNLDKAKAWLKER